MAVKLLSRNFRSAKSPELLDKALDDLHGVVNDLQNTLNGLGNSNISGGSSGMGGSGTAGGSQSFPSPSPQTTLPIPSLTLPNSTGSTIPKGTILGFLDSATNILIPALASGQALTRGVVIAIQDYQPLAPIIPVTAGVWQVLVDVTNSSMEVRGGQPCYLSNKVPGRTVNLPPASPDLAQLLGYYLSVVDVSGGTPLAWVGFVPNIQGNVGV